MEGENSRTPTESGIQRLAQKIALDGYSDVTSPLIVELRDRTQVTKYESAVNNHYCNVLFCKDVSDEDEKLYAEFLDTIKFNVIDGHHRLLALRYLQEFPRFGLSRTDRNDVVGKSK